MKYDNFKKIIPENVQDKIHSLVESIDFYEIINGHQESVSGQEISAIEGNYKEGWIPYQDGGFSVDQFYVSDTCSGFHFTEKQSEYMEILYSDMLAAFCSENGYETSDDIDYKNEETQDLLWEYEQSWFSEPALLQFQVFVDRENRFDDNSPIQVCCRLSINYWDAPYYREKYVEDIKQEIYTIEEFIQLENSVIIKSFKI